MSFFPYVIPAIAIGLIWSQIYDPSSGLLNGVLTKVGLDGFEDFAWLGERSTARWATMFVIIWGFVGFYMVLFIAAIKGVPAEIYDAARIDGAGRWRMATAVTIPMIRDAIQTAYIYLGILALDAFVYMQALTPAGGPDNSTLTISQKLFRTAFTKGKFGYAERDGRRARHRHAGVRRHRVHGQPAHRWQEPDRMTSTDLHAETTSAAMSIRSRRSRSPQPPRADPTA